MKAKLFSTLFFIPFLFGCTPGDSKEKTDYLNSNESDMVAQDLRQQQKDATQQVESWGLEKAKECTSIYASSRLYSPPGSGSDFFYAVKPDGEIVNIRANRLMSDGNMYFQCTLFPHKYNSSNPVPVRAGVAKVIPGVCFKYNPVTQARQKINVNDYIVIQYFEEKVENKNTDSGVPEQVDVLVRYRKARVDGCQFANVFVENAFQRQQQLRDWQSYPLSSKQASY